VILAVSGGLVVNAIPWSKQILKVFVRDPAGHDGRGIKSLWVSCIEICQLFPTEKKGPAKKGEAFYLMLQPSIIVRITSPASGSNP
jgi:hypothetical protein